MKPFKKCYLYRHVRLDKNEPFYIGIGSGRYYKRAKTKSGRNVFWNNIVNKTDYEVEIILDDLTWEESCKKEIEFISLYGLKNNGGLLCNLTFGGEGAYGRVLSEETKLKISNSNKGKKFSKETIEKLKEIKKGVFVGKNNPYYGKKHSEEIRNKISISKKGKTSNRKGVVLSEETKLKMSQSKKRKNATV